MVIVGERFSVKNESDLRRDTNPDDIWARSHGVASTASDSDVARNVFAISEGHQVVIVD